jgi:RHS repeat-associated protein
LAFTYTAATNHISGYTYDPAGNVTNDGTNTFQWDAESHLTKVINGQGVAISTNTYNALGQRVRDVTQTTTTDEAYGAGGSLLWRYTGNSSDPNQRAFVPFGGGILAEYFSGGTLFDHPDELGSISAASDQTGSHFQERLYYPFGESWTGVNLNNLGMHQTFAQLPDYDPETDQYNTANRHYSPSGRWMSPDPGGMKVVRLDDPQTWNMYAYVRNNPTTLEDPSGLEVAELPGRPSLPGYTPPDDTDLESGFSDWRGSLSPNTANASGASSPQNAAQNNNNQQPPAAKLSERDKAYLDKYHGPVTAQAKDYKVDPVLVLGVGIESGFASHGTYQRTGDAFGMTGGSTKNMTEAASPTENVKQFFDNFGSQIRGTGSNVRAFVNALEGQNAAGKPVEGWKGYNSKHPVEWRKMINAGIGQMKHDVPIYIAPN